MMMKLLQALERRIKNIVRRAVVTRVDASKKMTVLQVDVGGMTLDGIEYFECYGFTSVPHEGAEVLLLSLGGRSSHAIAVCVNDRRYRIKNGEAGDVVIYDHRGQTITLGDAGVTIDTPLALTINAGDSTFNGNIKATGNIDADGDVSDATGTIQVMRDTFNAHTQQVSGSTAAAPTTPMV